GAAGDFEDLVDRLQVLDGLPGAAPLMMDVSRPAAGMSYTNATLGIETGLRAPGVDSAGWPTDVATPFQQQLQQILEAPEKQTTPTPASLAPPVYGRWHAQVPAGSGGSPGMPSLSAAGWFRDLNLDPRYRVAAALGTQIVQRDQEQLVAAAWEQVVQI